MADHIDFMTDHWLDAEEQVLKRDPLLDLVRFAVDSVLAIAGEIDDRLADGLAGDSADIDADAAENRTPLDQHNALVQLGALNRGMMARGTRSYNHQIVFEISHRTLSSHERLQAVDSAGLSTSPPSVIQTTREILPIRRDERDWPEAENITKRFLSDKISQDSGLQRNPAPALGPRRRKLRGGWKRLNNVTVGNGRGLRRSRIGKWTDVATEVPSNGGRNWNYR